MKRRLIFLVHHVSDTNVSARNLPRRQGIAKESTENMIISDAGRYWKPVDVKAGGSSGAEHLLDPSNVWICPP